jgi:hypothetical protein
VEGTTLSLGLISETKQNVLLLFATALLQLLPKEGLGLRIDPLSTTTVPNAVQSIASLQLISSDLFIDVYRRTTSIAASQ